MRRTVHAVLAILLVTAPIQVYGFGPNGHRIVGQIAYNHLSTEARRQIDLILKGEPLAFAATWPDEMRSSGDPFFSYDAASNWHFINVPPGQNYAESTKEPKGDAFVALNAFIAILSDERLPETTAAEIAVKNALEGYLGSLDSDAAKQLAVRFLIHLVGDIHQPLHLGFAGDSGGNSIDVEWFEEASNLHEVWDEKLVNAPKLSFSEITEKIDRASAQQISTIQDATPLQWIGESLQLRMEAYGTQQILAEPGGTYRYIYIHGETIEDQMLKGGLRAAALFNQIFD